MLGFESSSHFRQHWRREKTCRQQQAVDRFTDRIFAVDDLEERS
jgi:hypothetical protein